MHTSYLDEVLDVKKFDHLAESVSNSILKHAPKAQAVAFRGCSGSLIGMAVCSKSKLAPILIRKVKSHSGMDAEGAISAKRYVIVDDFVETGATVEAIKRRLNHAKLLGVFCYAECDNAASRTERIGQSDVTIYKCG